MPKRDKIKRFLQTPFKRQPQPDGNATQPDPPAPFPEPSSSTGPLEPQSDLSSLSIPCHEISSSPALQAALREPGGSSDFQAPRLEVSNSSPPPTSRPGPSSLSGFQTPPEVGSSSAPQVLRPEPISSPEAQASRAKNRSTSAYCNSLDFPDGIKVLHQPDHAKVDICFVHGLTGDRLHTWTAIGQTDPWPKTLLPLSVRNARILTWGYDAYMVRASAASTLGVFGHAKNLLVDLANERVRSDEKTRPLIFVAHSLGGIVCKRALLDARNNPENHIREIYTCTSAIIFMGTPHKGAWMANWARIPVGVLGIGKSTNKKLAHTLSTDNQLLEALQGDFLTMLKDEATKIRTVCFYEELGVAGFGPVVSKDSATFEGYQLISIHANHSNMVKFASAEVTGFKRLVGELLRLQSQAFQPMTAAEIETLQACRSALAFPEMQTRTFDVAEAKAGTCTWLASHQKYAKWIVSDRGLLWIRGKPGSGKSILMKHILNSEAMRDAGEKSVILSFFFHGRGSELQKSPMGLYRALLHGILCQKPDALKDFRENFQLRVDHFGEYGIKWHWHPNQLRDFLMLALQQLLEHWSVWIFVDALDECGEKNAVKLTDTFKALIESLPSSTGFYFRMCFSCRHYPRLNSDGAFSEIHLEKNNKDDIKTYVRTALDEFGRSYPGSNIPKLIVDGASGVFLWARLVVDRVLQLYMEATPLRRIEAVIRDVPPDLDELYRNIIHESEPEALKLFQWVCCSLRPLSAGELQWAMLMEPDDDSYRSLGEYRDRHINFQDNLVDFRKWVTTLGRGLIEFRGVRRWLDSSMSAMNSPDLEIWHGLTTPTLARAYIAQFIHQSVKDFFLEGGLSTLHNGSEPTTPKAAINMAHYQIAKTCISYLKMDESKNVAARKDNGVGLPFLQYSIVLGLSHFAEYITDINLQEQILDCLEWPSNTLMEMFYRIRRYSSKSYNLADAIWTDRRRFRSVIHHAGDKLLHIASRMGWSGIVDIMLRQMAERNLVLDIDVKNADEHTPLALASSWGNAAVVKSLLETEKVDVESRSNDDETPLFLACLRGDLDVMELLLETGKADPNVKNKGSQTPLLRAALDHQTEVVRLLINSPKTDVDCIDYALGETPLHTAASEGNTEIAQLLLDTGRADINKRSHDDDTPFCLAVKSGEIDVVKMMIHRTTVNIDSKDVHGRTALWKAAAEDWSESESGRDEVVAFLLQTGEVDPDSKDAKGCTPLSMAARFGQLNIVKILLGSVRVDINSRDNNGQTPLWWAAAGGQTAATAILLNTGKADVNVKNAAGIAPFLAAASRGYVDVVRLLLTTSAVDIDVGTHRELRAACRRHGHLASVFVLAGIIITRGPMSTRWEDDLSSGSDEGSEDSGSANSNDETAASGQLAHRPMSAEDNVSWGSDIDSEDEESTGSEVWIMNVPVNLIRTQSRASSVGMELNSFGASAVSLT